jgi:hypothetical protein
VPISRHSRSVALVVSLAGGGLASPRSVLTNDAGEFTFSRLPAGTFTIVARKASYIAAAHGSQRPGRPGSSIALAAGQKLSVSVTMFKGAVIGGSIRDAAGSPIVGVSVSAVDARTSSGPNPAAAPTESAVTDDRGAYRIYGLLPGDYLVSATPSAGTGEIGARTSAEMDALLTSLAQRQNTPSAASTPAPLPTPPPVGFAPVYYPGTPLSADATPVHVTSGEERLGVSFELNQVRVATISGVVMGSVPNLAAVQLSLVIWRPANRRLCRDDGHYAATAECAGANSVQQRRAGAVQDHREGSSGRHGGGEFFGRQLLQFGWRRPACHHRCHRSAASSLRIQSSCMPWPM